MGKEGTSVISFLLGIIVGAVVALLYAPSSGEELRSQIKSEAEVRLEKLSAELEKSLADVKETVEKTRTELMSYLEQAQAEDKHVVVDENIQTEIAE
jgi:gas vesicle protein